MTSSFRTKFKVISLQNFKLESAILAALDVVDMPSLLSAYWAKRFRLSAIFPLTLRNLH